MPEKSAAKSVTPKRNQSSEKSQALAGSLPSGLKCSPAQRLQRAVGNQAFNRLVNGAGIPLDEQVQTDMEERFGQDLSGVRIHTGSAADEAARSLRSRAFTIGSDIAFKNGLYSPRSSEGRRLLAHELAHVIQQRNAAPTSNLVIGKPGGQAEVEAGMAGRMVASGQMPPALNAFGTQTILRDPDDTKPKYAAASKNVLQEMNRMSDELTKLRAAAPPAKNPAQEAQRTFAVIKVVDENGTVKQSVTGEFLSKGSHAEQQAISKLDIKSIGLNDTVLVATDQWPCEDKCTPALQKLRAQTKGEFRVFSKAGLNQSGNVVVRSPKTEAKKPGTNPGLVELEEFHRPPSTSVKPTGGGETGGKTGSGGNEPSSTAKQAQEPEGKPAPKAAPTGEPAEGKAPAAKTPVVTEADKPPAAAPKSVEPEVKPTTGAAGGAVEKPSSPAGKPAPVTEVEGETPSARPRVTIEGEAEHPRVRTGGWKAAGIVGTGATVGLTIYGAISTIDDAMARIEKAQTGSVHPEVAKAMDAVEKNFPKADDMWKKKFQSWQYDQKYPEARDWLINNGINALMAKGKDLETMGDHLNTLYWYNSDLEDLEFDYGKQIEVLNPIYKDVKTRTRVLFDISEDLLKQIPKWPNDTAQLTLWNVYTTFHDAAQDLSKLESQISMRLWEYNQRKQKAHEGRIESSKWLNYYSSTYAKVANKKVLQTKFSEE
jgi:hypothetical protein